MKRFLFAFVFIFTIMSTLSLMIVANWSINNRKRLEDRRIEISCDNETVVLGEGEKSITLPDPPYGAGYSFKGYKVDYEQSGIDRDELEEEGNEEERNEKELIKELSRKEVIRLADASEKDIHHLYMTPVVSEVDTVIEIDEPDMYRYSKNGETRYELADGTKSFTFPEDLFSANGFYMKYYIDGDEVSDELDAAQLSRYADENGVIHVECSPARRADFESYVTVTHDLQWDADYVTFSNATDAVAAITLDIEFYDADGLRLASRQYGEFVLAPGETLNKSFTYVEGTESISYGFDYDVYVDPETAEEKLETADNSGEKEMLSEYEAPAFAGDYPSINGVLNGMTVAEIVDLKKNNRYNNSGSEQNSVIRKLGDCKFSLAGVGIRVIGISPDTVREERMSRMKVTYIRGILLSISAGDYGIYSYDDHAEITFIQHMNALYGDSEKLDDGTYRWIIEGAGGKNVVTLNRGNVTIAPSII